MPSLDRCIEIQFALRNMANCALVIADLRPCRMIGSRVEVDVIVA